MKDVMALLRAKEQELLKVKRQVEALRIAAPLLGGEEDKANSSSGPVAAKGANSRALRSSKAGGRWPRSAHQR